MILLVLVLQVTSRAQDIEAKKINTDKTAMNDKNSDVYMRQMMVEIKNKDKVIDEKKLTGKHGYDLFNTINLLNCSIPMHIRYDLIVALSFSKGKNLNSTSSLTFLIVLQSNLSLLIIDSTLSRPKILKNTDNLVIKSFDLQFFNALTVDKKSFLWLLIKSSNSGKIVLNKRIFQTNLL